MALKAEEEQFLPSTPGKFKDKWSSGKNRQFYRCFASTSTMFLWALFLVALTAAYLSFQSFVDSGNKFFSAACGGAHWEKQIRSSAQIHRHNGFAVLVTVPPVSSEATHVMHLAAQAGVRYAMENPQSYVHSNIAGLVSLLEASKTADPQPAIVWASSSSVYGLNDKVPFSESDQTDRPASLYAATKKAGEEITHTYNHIYGLSITGLRFFTVYGPWGRPDMAYFSFTRNILQGKSITVYRGKNRVDLARDFTYIDDIVRGCVASLDTSKKSTGSGGKKRGPAQYRIFNLGNTSPVTVPQMVGILEKAIESEGKEKCD
ncbi:hypothetical protein BUALT_Bualt16G0096300 [Buddleja alternifolia]|uniref:NAD-dependent epimerase/dehydratase domain-containing protein n=1 Tax=Buddleja alternifolia TaxID=168488 RepID=A0AAV6WGY1_9LAMI|nr:hypothetical protein BUALT_Bualt16G0096300 [Buddleja alternifolia]